MSTNYKTHGHTLQKKIFFLTDIIIHENKGGPRHQVGEKQKFLARQKFLADGVAGDPKIWPNGTFWPNWPPSVAVFNLNKKQKSYGALKLVIQNFEKEWLATPFEMKQPVRNPFTWDVKKKDLITYYL